MDAEPSAHIIRWGIIGTGVVAQAFAEDLRLVPGSVLKAVASRDPRRGQAFADGLGGARVHPDSLSLARDAEVDVVYVASPHDCHRAHTMTCLDAGKAVLCEKPFAQTGAEGREMIARARQAGTFCMEAMWMRFHPLVRKVREMVRAGELGQIRLLTAEFGYPTPFDPKGRFFDPERGGGALLDRGVYLLSLAHFLLGAPADLAGFPSVGETHVDEQAAILLKYEGPALAVLTTSLRSRLGNEARIIGTRGTLVLHDPFFAPTRLTWAPHEEPAGPAAPSGHRGGSGWKAQIRRSPVVRRVFDMIGRPLLRTLRRETTFTEYPRGHGYEYETAEVVRCLREGLRESSAMPLDESQEILDLTDHLRSSWNLPGPEQAVHG